VALLDAEIGAEIDRKIFQHGDLKIHIPDREDR
jgi:hypothetical protein